jgi:hypothetical protein
MPHDPADQAGGEAARAGGASGNHKEDAAGLRQERQQYKPEHREVIPGARSACSMSVALCNRRRPVDFRYAPFATEGAWRCNM